MRWLIGGLLADAEGELQAIEGARAALVGIKIACDRYTAGQCHHGGGTQVSMETPEQRAERFREQARKLRALAETTTDPKIKNQMLSMADQYEALAAQALDP